MLAPQAKSGDGQFADVCYADAFLTIEFIIRRLMVVEYHDELYTFRLS